MSDSPPSQAAPPRPRQEGGGARSVGRNALALYGAEMTAKALAFVGVVLLARGLGSADFGRFAFAGSVTALLSIVADPGVTLSLTKLAALEPEREQVWMRAAGGVRLLASLVVVLGAVAYWGFSGSERVVRDLVLIIALVNPLQAIAGLYQGIFRARQQMGKEAAVRVLGSLLTLFLLLGVILSGRGLAAVGWAYVIAAAISAAAYFLLGRSERVEVSGRLPVKEARRFLGQAVPLGLIAVFSGLYFRIDAVMLQYWSGAEAVGLYTAAYRLLEGVLVFPAMLATALFPTIVRQLAVEPGRAAQTSILVMKYSLILTIPVVAIGSPLAVEITRFLYGQQFDAAGVVLQVLLCASLPISVATVTCVVLNASERPWVYAVISGVMLFCNIALNFALIPTLGPVGAGLATVTTEVGILLLSFLAVEFNILRIHRFLLASTGPVVAGVGAGLLGVVLPTLWVIPMQLAVYGTLLYVFGVVPTQERRILMHVLRPTQGFDPPGPGDPAQMSPDNERPSR